MNFYNGTPHAEKVVYVNHMVHLSQEEPLPVMNISLLDLLMFTYHTLGSMEVSIHYDILQKTLALQ